MELFRTPLGNMKILEMFLYYDRPFIFLCEDDIGTKYIVHLIDEDDVGERWFLVPSSDIRVEYVRTGRITLRNSIIQAEGGWIWEVITPYDSSEGDFFKKECSIIIDLDLPEVDAVFSLPARTKKTLPVDPEKEAMQKARNILLLSLDDGNHSQDISINDYGTILLRGQHLITALALECGSRTKGKIPRKTIEDTTFNYVGGFVASVGIKLESKNGNLFDPCIEQSLERMVALLNAGSNKETLTPLLQELPLRATARYRFLLEALDQAQLSFKMDWTSPHKGRKKVEISHSQIQAVIDILNLEGEDMSQLVTLKGDLLGLLIDGKRRRSSFEFVESDGDKFKGVLSPELLEQVDQDLISFPLHNVKVELEEIIEINPSTSEEHISYILTKIFVNIED